ncbi:MAG: FAD-dependent oxidoreductase [Oscillospiraceae bacterium]|jgi:flavorubredoxin/NADPH-dependent 2,4-dienoyl-CoA reductase/sulfur reductase-like enzyme|nr:FAD-dependent oxidoreductase [Oscillospiraceae bacterium]
MKTLKLKEGLYWTGVLDPQLRVFDIIMETEFGTTYNSYLLKGSEKTALFETAKEKYFDEYLEKVKELTDPSKIDYIIVNHTEPDHAGSLAKLLDYSPNANIVATPTAIGFLKHILNRDFYSIPVQDGDTLSLGDKTLRFLSLPNLHWPDSMYTYAEEDKVLFTCDSFGSHYSHEGILRSTVTDTEGYMRATKYYFDNILGPFKRPYLTNALKKIQGLPLEMICTGHGPVLDSHIDELMAIYQEWCAAPEKPEKKLVVIPYVSAYGYTAMLAEKIAKGVEDCGGIEVRLYDLVGADQSQVLGDIAAADGLLFGTPTILGEALAPIWGLLTSMYPPVHGGKLASAFGSYGWSGEGVPHIVERLKQLRLKVVDGFRVRFKPDDNQLTDAYEFGYQFGCTLLGKENDRKQAGKRKVLKCLVCGAILEEGTQICPVCGVGPENFVEVEESENAFVKDTEEIFLILGAGAAGVSAAEAIRQRNRTASIVLVSQEKALPYNRPMLTKNMFAGLDEEHLAIHPARWYEENNIYRVAGKEIEKIDPAAHEVTMTDGSKFSYAKCIYALGARCFVPPIPGAEQPGVVAVRTLEDVKKVKNALEAPGDAVVIGGGVLGLEAAWELHREGRKVTVLEVADRLLAGKADTAVSEMLSAAAKAQGITIRTGAVISQITGQGAVTGVTLADGETLPAVLVVVSCGIRANTDVAKAAGLTLGRAVQVDDQMRTSAADIFACGDCAEYQGVNTGLWSQAVEMGKAAGAAAAGDDSAPYVPQTPALHLAAFGTSLYSVGDSGSDPKKQYKTVEFRDDQRRTIEKYYFFNGRLVGATLLGDTSKLALVTEAVSENRSFKSMF